MIREIPSGKLVLRDGSVEFYTVDVIKTTTPNGQEKTETRESYQSIEEYLRKREYDAERSLKEMERFLEYGDFSDVPTHLTLSNREKKFQKNSEMKNHLIDLLEDIQRAENLKQLDEIYNEIIKILEKYDKLVFDDDRAEDVRRFISESGGIYGDLDMYSGMPKNLLYDAIEDYGYMIFMDSREIFRMYVDTAYSHLKDKFLKIEESNMLQKEAGEEERSYGQEKGPEEHRDYIKRKEKAQNKLDNAKRELADREQGLQQLKKELVELNEQKRQLELAAISRGLYKTEEVDDPIPIYNDRTGNIICYVNSRYISSDEERKKHEEAVSKIEQQIKDIEKKIEDLKFEIERYRQRVYEKEREASEIKSNETESVLSDAESRFYGMGKVRQALAVLSGKKAELDALKTQGDITDDEILAARRMFK